MASTMSGLMAAMSSGAMALMVPTVPTGMNMGVCTTPCAVTSVPARAAPSRALYALILLLVAAGGGLLLVSYHLRNRLPPRIIVIAHAGCAVAGFLTLASLLLP